MNPACKFPHENNYRWLAVATSMEVYACASLHCVANIVPTITDNVDRQVARNNIQFQGKLKRSCAIEDDKW